MKQLCSPRFLVERARFSLRFTCEHCSHYQAEHKACTHGYPTEAHRGERYEQADAQAELVFCKDFDLW